MKRLKTLKLFLQWHFITPFLLTGNLLYPLGILFQRFLKLVLCNAANPVEEKRQEVRKVTQIEQKKIHINVVILYPQTHDEANLLTKGTNRIKAWLRFVKTSFFQNHPPDLLEYSRSVWRCRSCLENWGEKTHEGYDGKDRRSRRFRSGVNINCSSM